MQTRLIYSDSVKNLEIAKKQLARKYTNFDELSLEVQRDRCSNPDKIDDYMLWHTIKSIEKEQAPSGSDTTITTGGPYVFREEIIFQTTDLYGFLTPRRMELLEYIHVHNPISMKTLAAEIKRDYKNVYDDVLALQRAHLLDLVREGKNKRPVSRVTAIEIFFRR